MNAIKRKRGRPRLLGEVPHWIVRSGKSNLAESLCQMGREFFVSQDRQILEWGNCEKSSRSRETRKWIATNCTDLLRLKPRVAVWKIQTRMADAGLKVPMESTMYRHINAIKMGQIFNRRP